jgi:hypothetical protein
MTAAPTAELVDQVAADVGVIARAWAASRGNHHQQAQVAAAALNYVLTQTPTLLQVFIADAALATEHHQQHPPEESVL